MCFIWPKEMAFPRLADAKATDRPMRSHGHHNAQLSHVDAQKWTCPYHLYPSCPFISMSIHVWFVKWCYILHALDRAKCQFPFFEIHFELAMNMTRQGWRVAKQDQIHPTYFILYPDVRNIYLLYKLKPNLD